MIGLRRLLRFGVALAVAGILVAPAAVRADFMLSLANGSSTVYGSPSGPDGAVYSGLVGNFNVVIAYGSSNAPGGENALGQVGSIVITNTSNSTQTLTMEISATGFYSPQSPPPLNIYDTVSGSVATGSLIQGTFQGFADTTNSSTPGAGTAGQLINIGTYGASTSFAGNGAIGGVFSPNGATYSVSIIETLEVAANTTLTLTGGNVQVMMPAPTNLLLALAGTGVLSFWSFWRRKQAGAVALGH